MLAGHGDDALGALSHLLDLLGGGDPVLQQAGRPGRPTGALTGEAVADALGALLPEGAIVSDEANTAGLWLSGVIVVSPPLTRVTMRRCDAALQGRRALLPAVTGDFPTATTRAHGRCTPYQRASLPSADTARNRSSASARDSVVATTSSWSPRCSR